MKKRLLFLSLASALCFNHDPRGNSVDSDLSTGPGNDDDQSIGGTTANPELDQQPGTGFESANSTGDIKGNTGEEDAVANQEEKNSELAAGTGEVNDSDHPEMDSE